MKQDNNTTLTPAQKNSEIVNKLYTAYGSGSGVLFGITDKAAVEAIVNFALDYSEPLPAEHTPLLDVQDEKVMNKEQAIEAMKKGARVTHKYFMDSEWITMAGNIIKMEQGQECWATEFWQTRTSSHWLTGWTFHPSNPKQEDKKEDVSVRDKAIEWFDNLSGEQRSDLAYKYFYQMSISLTGKQVEFIYKAENHIPSLVEDKKYVQNQIRESFKNMANKKEVGSVVGSKLASIGADIFCGNRYIALCSTGEINPGNDTLEKNKSYARRIVACFNEYDKLKADNEALVSALKWVIDLTPAQLNNTKIIKDYLKSVLNTIEGNKQL